MYLTYAEYQDMGGTLDETAFNDYEFQAEALVNWYTFNRLVEDGHIPNAVKQVIKYLINSIQQQNALLSQSSGGDNTGATTAAIAAQSNDGVSVSYNVLSAAELFRSLKAAERNTIDMYLQGVVNEVGRKLLYRGLYPGE